MALASPALGTIAGLLAGLPSLGMAADGRLNEMFTGLSQTLTGLGDLFNSAFAAGAHAMGTVGENLGEFGTSLGKFIERIEPLLSTLSNTLLAGLTTAMDELGPVLERAAGPIQSLLDKLAPVGQLILDVATVIANDLTNALASPFVQQFAESFGQFAEQMNADLVARIGEVVVAIKLLNIAMSANPFGCRCHELVRHADRTR